MAANLGKTEAQGVRHHPPSNVNVVTCHYLLNVFKTTVAIILKILSLLSVVLRFLDDKIILILSYFFFRSSP